MKIGDQFKLGNLSDVIIRADGTEINIYDYIVKIIIQESIFVPYVRGSITIRDTSSLDVLKKIEIKGGPETSIQFSFNGVEDDGVSQQPEISITHDDYRILAIEHSATFEQEKYTKIYFVHKLFFINEGKEISKGYSDKKISTIVEDLGSFLDISWEEIEPTQNTITTGLPYDKAFNHIATLLKYSIRKSNINDVNYLFWQNLNHKHNYVSLGKLYEQESSFGNDIDSGFVYGRLTNDLNFKQIRRLVAEHHSIGKSTLETTMTGAYASEMLFVDTFFKDNQQYINFNSRDKWNKSSHLSTVPKNQNNSEFWDYINNSILTRTYTTNTNGYCCEEKDGGQRNPLYSATKRLSQISSFFQFGVRIVTTGNSDLNQIGAGKIFYFGRPLMNPTQNKKQEDIFFSGKFLASTVKHVIMSQTENRFKYFNIIQGYKDSLGEE